MQGQERSKLDYILRNSKLLSIVTEIIIDENKQYGVFKLGKIRKIYSENIAILLRINLITATEK